MQMLHAMKNFKFRIFIVHPQHLSFTSKNEEIWELELVSNTHALDELSEHLEANNLEKVPPSPCLPFPFVL